MVASLQMGRPFFAPPGVPADRVQILRRALDATAKDPAFLADVEKQKVEVFHMTGEEVEALVRRIHAMPKDSRRDRPAAFDRQVSEQRNQS